MTRAVVTGGGGFLGSHFCDRLLAEGWDVLCLDSLLTGNEDNLAQARGNERFTFERRDVSRDLKVDGDFDWVLHLASAASPVDYQRHPVATLEVGALGTLNALELAKEKGASFFLTSTSEVYGDPKVHPQPESYWGNVNPIGPRSMYDESKRFSEAAAMAYHRSEGVPVRIVRIFNTYGPRMRRHDGRAVPNFIAQSIAGDPLTVHGDGAQTRSLCFVDDLIEGMFRFMMSDEIGPMNMGNPEEISMLDLAALIAELAGSNSEVVFEDRPVDDPELRRPDITYAKSALGWEPKVTMREGLTRTIDWAREAWF